QSFCGQRVRTAPMTDPHVLVLADFINATISACRSHISFSDNEGDEINIALPGRKYGLPQANYSHMYDFTCRGRPGEKEKVSNNRCSCGCPPWPHPASHCTPASGSRPGKTTSSFAQLIHRHLSERRVLITGRAVLKNR